MKAKIIALALIVTTTLIAVIYDQMAEPNLIPTTSIISNDELKPMPEVKAMLINGKSINLNDLKEPIILLNFWATWCAPCLKEMPQMVQLANDSNGKIALVTVSIDDNKQNVISYINKFKKQTPQTDPNMNTYWIWDEFKEISLKKFNVSRVPETIIINQNRQMVSKVIGEHNWADPNIKNNLLRTIN